MSRRFTYRVRFSNGLTGCPTCQRESTWENNPHRPFCSERCQLIDLGAWAEEKYRIPGDKLDSEPDGDDEDDAD